LSDGERDELLNLVKEGKYEILREKPNTLGRASFKGIPVFIKIFKRKKFFSFILSPLRHSSSFRSYNTALHMLKNRIDTPKPLLSFERRKMGFVVEDLYVTEDIGEHLSARQAVLNAESEARKEIIKRIAQVVRRIHESFIHHMDLNLSNFLLKDDKIYVMDINRAKISKKPLSVFKRAHDISKIDLHGLQRIFISEYVRGFPRAWVLKNLTLLFIKMRKLRRVRRFFVRLIDRWIMTRRD